MMFDLELLGRPEGEGDRLFIWGRIRLGQFQDEFQVPLYDWAPGDYVAQWLDAAGAAGGGRPRGRLPDPHGASHGGLSHGMARLAAMGTGC